MTLISERTTTTYRGFKIVAGRNARGYRAVGHCRFAQRLDVVAGNSVSEAVKACRTEIDRVVSENGPVIRQRLISGHAAWLRAKGRPYVGVREPGGYFRRVSHCYACKTTVDNSYDLECARCGWIICGHCGACGCSSMPRLYPSFGLCRSTPTRRISDG